MNAVLRRAFFLKTFITDYKVGAVTHSSRYMGRSIARYITPATRTVIEYGPGIGTVTKLLLHSLPPEGELIVVEPNRHFVQILRQLHDPRLRIIHATAQQFNMDAHKHGVIAADLIV